MKIFLAVCLTVLLTLTGRGCHAQAATRAMPVLLGDYALRFPIHVAGEEAAVGYETVDVHITRRNAKEYVDWSVMRHGPKYFLAEFIGSDGPVEARIRNDHALSFAIENDGWDDYGHGYFYRLSRNRYILKLVRSGHRGKGISRGELFWHWELHKTA